MLKIVDGILVDLTGEEEAMIKSLLDEYRRKQAKVPMTLEEVYDTMAKALVNEVNIPDETSLRMKSYYPTFESIIGKEVKEGFKFTYKDDLWKTRQKHTPQEQYPPSVDTASLYERIDEVHAGTLDDPIPYDQTMTVSKNIYYSYENTIYLCIRDSGVPLYADPGSLIDNYFIVAKSAPEE